MIQYTLNNGQKIPALGLGTWKSEKNKVCDAVKTAMEVGYKHIDCALVYSNETEVGEGIATKIQDGTITREDIFVTSKLWTTYMRPDLVCDAIQKTLSDLKLDYLDLYLIHIPVALKPGDKLLPTEADGSAITIDVDYLDTYKELEKLVDQGKVKAIGVSNFNISQMKRVVDNCRIKPVVNQIEMHPYLTQHELVDECVALGVHVSAYSPLGSPDRPWAPKDETGLLQDPIICEMGRKYNKSPAQVLIRYPIQRGLSVLPKSVTPERIQENFQIMDFELSSEDMARLNKLNRDVRYCKFEVGKHSKYYPF